MADEDDGPAQSPEWATERPPGEVLAVAGNETRLSIIRALFEADGQHLRYAELMDAVEMDDSGQFNYHLSQLVGPFVQQTDDGYHLRHAGGQVIGAVMAGTYSDERSLGPVEVATPCPTCDGSLLASYDGDVARIGCDDCGTVVTHHSVPPGIFEGYQPTDLPAVLGRWVRHEFARTLDGFCPVCTGRTDGSLGTPEHSAQNRVGIELVCRRCGMRFTGAVGSAVLDHPVVLCFYHDHGIDLRTIPIWELDWLHDDSADLVGGDPPEAELTIELDDERLVMTLDDDLAVVATERQPT